MKILLFNDNPVVRKLVALSAQKTKDDLSVVWSTDEIEDREYDLLIVDDALYSDEILDALKEKIALKSSLFMATRGKAVPSGFDHVINKPFLPTDLVDLFVQIEKKIGGETTVKSTADDLSSYSINLEDSLSQLHSEEDETATVETLEGLEDDFDFDSLDDYKEKLPETAILDQEEVQEVQGLLDETEGADLNLEDDFAESPIEAITMPDEEIGMPIELEDDFAFDDKHIMDEVHEDDLLNFENDIADDETSAAEGEKEIGALLDEEEFGDLELSMPDEEELDMLEGDELLPMDDENTLDETALPDDAELAALSDDEDVLAGLEEIDETTLMNDDELGDLELKIEDAMSGLESEDLEKELDSEEFDLDLNDEMMEELLPTEQEDAAVMRGECEGFDELDMLDERELKLAIGEEVGEEEPTIVAKGGSSLAAEALDEVMSESSSYADFSDTIEEEKPSSHAEGVEALQALLKALANENVSKSLKGMNISININFGNDA